MSLFLQNLITRHQDAGINPASSPVVQPRPKARFESGQTIEEPTRQETNQSTDFKQSNAYHESQNNHSHGRIKEADSDQDSISHSHKSKPSATQSLQNISRSTDISQQTHSNSITESFTPRYIPRNIPLTKPDQPSSQPEKPSTSQQDKETITPPYHSATDHVDLNQRITALSIRLGEKNRTRQNTLGSEQTQKLNFVQPEEHAQFPAIDTPQNKQNMLLAGDLQQRIQNILQRINRQKPQQAEQTGESKYSLNQHLTETNSDATQGTEQIVAQLALPVEPPSPVAKVVQPDIQQLSSKSSAHQADLLHTPQWLSELQASLNSQVQTMSTQPSPEPTINVTIGRVEVKAVKSETLKQVNSRSKPKAAMSLDDYLQQRSGKGYA